MSIVRNIWHAELLHEFIYVSTVIDNYINIMIKKLSICNGYLSLIAHKHNYMSSIDKYCRTVLPSKR